jgi:hypothetical protein
MFGKIYQCCIYVLIFHHWEGFNYGSNFLTCYWIVQVFCFPWFRFVRWMFLRIYPFFWSTNCCLIVHRVSYSSSRNTLYFLQCISLYYLSVFITYYWVFHFLVILAKSLVILFFKKSIHFHWPFFWYLSISTLLLFSSFHCLWA